MASPARTELLESRVRLDWPSPPCPVGLQVTAVDPVPGGLGGEGGDPRSPLERALPGQAGGPRRRAPRAHRGDTGREAERKERVFFSLGDNGVFIPFSSIYEESNCFLSLSGS